MTESSVGVVVIGRNEGARLERCLESVTVPGRPVVYVDSGSSDDSVARARRMGVRVILLDPGTPFSAARARNAGALALLSERQVGWLQFVDGDCTLMPGWLERGCAYLAAHPRCAAVAGRLRERAPWASPYNRLCDMEWHVPEGPSDAVGGVALFRTSALMQAGGFDSTLICGEEPELCLRLRRTGWEIRALPDPMALHDADIHRFGQFARRAMRSGWAVAEGADRHGAGPERYNMRACARIWFWAAILPLVLGLAGLAWWASGATWLGIAVLGGVLAYPLMLLRIARQRFTGFGDRWNHALLYGAFLTLARPWQLWGMLRYHLNKARGGPARIIEHKPHPRQQPAR